MERILKRIEMFTPSIILVLFGIYMVKCLNSILAKTVGIIMILFFVGLIVWGIYKLLKISSK
jgi:uncharacterized membrane protein